MKRLIFVLSLVILGLFAAQGEAQTLCIGPNCPGTGGGGGGTDLTIGVSTITGGTNARVLYDNGGVVGEYTITGTGNVVLSTAPRFGGTVNFGTASTTTGSIAMFKAGSAFGVTIGTTDQTVGNVALTIPNFASVADTFVFTTLAQTLSNKTFVAPALGTPASGVMTNVTGTASGLTAGNVTTNANLTGPITSVGNATTITDAAVTLAKMANLAQDQFIGRTTASTGVPETATITAAARAVLDDTTVGAMVDTLGGASSSGTGGLARVTSPSFTTPALGTPSAAVLTNATGTASGLTAGAATLAISTSALKSATTTVNVDAATAPSAGQVLTATDSTHATWQAAASPTITSGTTATSGCVAGGIVYSISNLVKCNGNFTFDNNLLTIGNVTTAGRAIIKTQDTITGSSATSNFLNITGTFPATLSAATAGVLFSFIGDNDAQTQSGLTVQLTPAVGSSHAIKGELLTGTSSNPNSAGYFSNTSNGAPSFGSISAAVGIGGGGGSVYYGSIGLGSPSNGGGAWGAIGSAIAPVSSFRAVGVAGSGDSDADTAVGVYGIIESAPMGIGSAAAFTAPIVVKSAGLFENKALAVTLLVASDNGAILPSTGATATWSVKDGAIPQVGTGVLTTATMTAEAQAYAQGSIVHSATWTNAQVVALGASLTGDIKAFTIPAKHVVENAYVIITGAGAGTTTLTVSCGRTSASYIDYIVASDAQAAANTVYGDASAERGTNLTGYDLPSYTGTTDVYCHFTSTVSNLSAVTGSTGRVVLVTTLIP